MKHLIIAAIVVFTLAACKKNKTSSPAVAHNTWAVNNTSYSADTNIVYGVYGRPNFRFFVAGTFADASFINVDMVALPVQPGFYKIVANPQHNNEMGVYIRNGGVSGSYYEVASSNDAMAYVWMNNGKVSMIATQVMMKNSAPTATDSMQMSFNLMEF